MPMKNPIESFFTTIAIGSALSAFLLLLLLSGDYFSSIETLISRDWKCARYDLTFTDAGTYKLVSPPPTSAVWEGKYTVDTSSKMWGGEIKAVGAPHPLNEYRFLKAKPTTTLGLFSSFKGLILYREVGQEFIQCEPA
jgi:hypothetical protein